MIPDKFEFSHDYKSWSEKTLQATIIQVAGSCGFTQIYHTHYSVGSQKGYPDLTCVKPYFGVVWLELKGPKTRVQPEQVEWIWALQNAGQHAYVIRPEDVYTAVNILMGKYGGLAGGYIHDDLQYLNRHLYKKGEQ